MKRSTLAAILLVCCPLVFAQTIFVRGGDAALWIREDGGGFGSLNVPLAGAPDACQTGDTVFVTARGEGGAAVIRSRTGRTWTDWRSLGGEMGSDVAVACMADGSGRLFARGMDGALWTRGTDAQQGWTSLGGSIVGAPDAAVSANGAIDVVARTGDGTVWHIGWNGQQWTQWRNVGGSATGDPSIAWMTPDRAEVVIVVEGGRLQHGTLRPDTAVSWQAMPGVVRGAPAAASQGDGHLDLVARGTDDAIWTNSFDGTRWSGWTTLGGRVTSDPAALPMRRVVTAVPAGGAGGAVTAIDSTPVIPLPDGYGYYCSMSWPDGRFAFAFEGSDPCGDLRRRSAGGIVERAGIYSLQGWNNAMVRCGTFFDVRKNTGQSALRTIQAQAEGKSRCVFVASPVDLPIFVRPYAPATVNPDAGMVHATGFDYAQFGRSLDASMFREGASGNATQIDHWGRAHTDGQDNHEGHDYMLGLGRGIRAVAAGRVLAVRQRDTSGGAGCTPLQPEIYIVHRVGSGEYEERFVSYYAHMDTMSVSTGQDVTAGQQIGTAGTKGCSSGPHLHLSITRLTNLTGSRFLEFSLVDTGRGDTGMAGRIDPYGWQAPRHIDPWAWMYLGEYYDYDRRLQDPGAFSINLWGPGEEPVVSNW